jgi:hypothetical protein
MWANGEGRGGSLDLGEDIRLVVEIV